MIPDFALTVATIMLYRLGILAIGGLSIWLGYKLFRAGVLDKSADEIQMVFGKNKFVAKAAAPGAVLAVFGAMVIGVSICFPAHFKRETEHPVQSTLGQGQKPLSGTNDLPAPGVARDVIASVSSGSVDGQFAD